MLTPRVVLVEDNTTIRETLVPALQELAGARVVAMADGAQEALATLRQVPWDVLVLDMFLREGTGLEVLAQLPGELAGRKVYVLTNYATADLREACVRLGADAVFDKSTELDEFFAAFRIYVVGGTEKWQKKAAEVFPTMHFLGSEKNFDSSALAQADYVIINTNAVSHACTEKAKNAAPKSAAIIMTSNNNLPLLRQKLLETIQ